MFLFYAQRLLVCFGICPFYVYSAQDSYDLYTKNESLLQ